MINVVIADDHQLFIDGVKSLLESEAEIQISGEATSGDAILSLLDAAPTDLVLLDLNMPESDGIELTGRIKEFYPEVKVLILSQQTDKELVHRMLRAGAAGCILKDSSKQELLKAIHHVTSGDVYYSGEVTRAMIRSMMPGAEPEEVSHDDGPLTRRERDVLCCIVNEMTTNETAAHLHISPHTVETHRKNLASKLEVRNTAGLVKWAIAHGIC